MLAFEPPHFSHATTLGGCVAAGLAGPRRASAGFTHGSIRDFLLGARLLDGRGRLLRFGGTVMKNVAGFDVSRVLAGSLGILGLIVEVSLKVVPRPACERTLRLAMPEAQALERLNEWAGLPLPVSASHWRDGELTLRISGAEPAVLQAATRFGGQALEPDAASEFWRALRDHQDPWFAGTAPLWRLSLPSTAPPLNLDEPQCIEWGGALRWLRSPRPAAEIRAQAAALGGHATLFRHGAGAAAVEGDSAAFTPLSAPLLAIHQRLKEEFDPKRLFNPGRLVVGL
jgi:glycolate oxidase FAD binding subunit